MGKKPKLQRDEFRITFKGKATYYENNASGGRDFHAAAQEILTTYRRKMLDILERELPLQANSHYDGTFSFHDEVDVEA